MFFAFRNLRNQYCSLFPYSLTQVCQVAVLIVSFFSFNEKAFGVAANFSGGFRFDDNYLTDVGHAPEGTDITGSTPVLGSQETQNIGGNAHYQTLHLRLIPRLIVNDQTIIYSQWQVGPTWGKFVGDDSSYQFKDNANTSNTAQGTNASGFSGRDNYDFSYGRESLTSTRSTSALQWARAWGEFITDFGTLRLGRMPREWGYGVVWHGGNDIRDRFQSTADTTELAIKFGNFELTPGFSRVISGDLLILSDDINDFHISGLYDNPEEDIVLGIYWNQRKGGNRKINLYDIIAKKRIRKFEIGAEIPIINGSLGNRDHSTVAVAAEASYEVSDVWKLRLQFGNAPGEDTSSEDANAYWFHPNYKVGNLMFSRNWQSLIENSTQDPIFRPYNKSVVNAQYAALSGTGSYDQWTWNLGVLYAVADETAENGQTPFDYPNAEEAGTTAGVTTIISAVDQEKDLGVEIFGGFDYAWNENTSFIGEFGVHMPGKYYAYTVTGNDGSQKTRWMWSFQAAVNF